MAAENKHDEEIPAITVKTEEELAEIEEKLRWRPTYYRIAEFFIGDLLRAEKAEDSFFQFRGIIFKAVKIRGTVVGVGHLGLKVVLTVDDGTAQIDCILSPNERLAGINEVVNEALRMKTEFQEDAEESEPVENEAVLLLLSLCKKKFSTVPLHNDVELGDTVILVGNLSEYYENRNVFINHISKIKDSDAAAEAQHLKRMFDLYENFYVK